MKRYHIFISVFLLGLFVVTPLLHATHSHRPTEYSGSDGISSNCAICASGPIFDASPASNCSHPAPAIPAAAAEPHEPGYTDSLPQTAAEPRAPPFFLV
jgi:hypothetical protein